MNASAAPPSAVFHRLCLIGFFARFSYALARNPVLPLFALALGAGPEGIGLAVGVSTVTGILFKMPSGALSDIIGRRRTMLAGLVFFAVTPFFYLWIDHYASLVLLRFVHGLATAIYGPVAMAVVAEAAGERKGELLSWFSSVSIAGALLGAPIGGWMLLWLKDAHSNELWAYRMVFLLSAGAGVGALLLGLFSLRKGDQPISGQGLAERTALFYQGIKQVAADKRVLMTSAMEGVQNMSMGALEAFLPVYAVAAGLNVFQAGLIWGLQIVATLIAKPLMGKVSDRWGRRPLIVAGMALCALPFALIPHLLDFTPLMSAAMLFGLGEALVTSSSAALVADFCQAERYGAAMGVFGSIFDIGHAAGPILTGLLIAVFGYGWAFTLVASLMLASIPLFLALVREEPNRVTG